MFANVRRLHKTNESWETCVSKLMLVCVNVNRKLTYMLANYWRQLKPVSIPANFSTICLRWHSRI